VCFQNRQSAPREPRTLLVRTARNVQGGGALLERYLYLLVIGRRLHAVVRACAKERRYQHVVAHDRCIV
jgi:hypothetical protein